MCRSLIVNIPIPTLALQPHPVRNRAMELFIQEPHIAETASELVVNRAYLLGFITTMIIVWCFYLLSQLPWHP